MLADTVVSEVPVAADGVVAIVATSEAKVSLVLYWNCEVVVLTPLALTVPFRVALVTVIAVVLVAATVG